MNLPFPSAPAAKNPGKMKMLSQSHPVLGQVLRVCSPRGPGLEEDGKPGGGRCLSLLCALLHGVRAKAERWNEEMAPRKCPRCSRPRPSAPPPGFRRRREGELCSTSPQSGVLPPVPEDQTHEPRVSLASNETFHVFCLLFPLVKPALGRLPLLSGSV